MQAGPLWFPATRLRPTLHSHTFFQFLAFNFHFARTELQPSLQICKFTAVFECFRYSAFRALPQVLRSDALQKRNFTAIILTLDLSCPAKGFWPTLHAIGIYRSLWCTILISWKSLVSRNAAGERQRERERKREREGERERADVICAGVKCEGVSCADVQVYDVQMQNVKM